MSGSNDDLDLENVLEDDAEDVDLDAASDEDQGPVEEQASDKSDKRVNDLMSKWQKAEAKAKKLEEQLSKGAGAQAGAEQQGAAVAPELAQWIELAREQARDQIYASDPRFADYGLDRGSITGSTPDQMRESAKRLSEFLDKTETRMQDAILRKHGLSPEVRSAPAQKTKSFGDMSDEEFEKLVSRAKSG